VIAATPGAPFTAQAVAEFEISIQRLTRVFGEREARTVASIRSRAPGD